VLFLLLELLEIQMSAGTLRKNTKEKVRSFVNSFHWTCLCAVNEGEGKKYGG